jgi:hypothetical protein
MAQVSALAWKKDLRRPRADPFMTDTSRLNNTSERRPPLSTVPALPAVDGLRTPQSTLEQIYSFDAGQSQGGAIDFDTWFGQHLVDFDSIFQAS